MRRAWNWLLSRLYLRLADAHRHFGNLYGNDQEHWSAIENYTRATILDPDYTQAYFNRGVLYWREIGNTDRAIQDLDRVLELDPTWSEAYFNRALAHRLRGDRARAIADLEAYLAAGTDEYWLDSARRQIEEIKQEEGEEKSE